MGSKRKYLRTHAKSIIVCIIVISLIISFIIIPPMFSERPEISMDGMNDYIKEYFYEYSYLYKQHDLPLASITNWSNFTFGLRSFDTLAVISTNHGVALFFTPSQSGFSQVTVKEITYPVEYYVWPQMATNIDELPSVAIEPGEYFLDGVVTVHDSLMYIEPGAILRCVLKDRPINVTNTGAVLVFGTYILEHSILLKGSNSREDWSRNQADLDALSEYLYDCKSTGINASLLNDIETKYKSSMLLNRIASRMKSGVYRDNQALFNSDYEELRRVAANTMDDMLAKVLNDYYTLQQEVPSSFLNQVANWFVQKADALFLAVITTLTITWVSGKLKPRSGKRKKKD